VLGIRRAQVGCRLDGSTESLEASAALSGYRPAGQREAEK
jgi:hypothetical protein